MASKKAAGPKVADRARAGKGGKAKGKGEAATAKALKQARAEIADNIERIDAGDAAAGGAVTHAATGGEGAAGGALPTPAASDATGAIMGHDAAKPANRRKAR